jgi:hypothetical protein
MALKLGHDKTLPKPKIFDTSIKFKPAPEPTNIIWENMHFSVRKIRTRALVSVGVLAFSLLVAFAIFFILKTEL